VSCTAGHPLTNDEAASLGLPGAVGPGAPLAPGEGRWDYQMGGPPESIACGCWDCLLMTAEDGPPECWPGCVVCWHPAATTEPCECSPNGETWHDGGKCLRCGAEDPDPNEEPHGEHPW